MNINKKESKNWSVILLMAIGVLFVTIAGCIFVSNTWKIMTDEAKEISLAAITIGIFIGSFILRKNDAFKITGKALYYLGVAASAFSTYMILGNFNYEIEDFAEVKAFKFFISTLVMLAEIAHIYFNDKKIIDLIFSYIISNITAFSFIGCFSLSLENAILIFAIETLFLSINYFIINRNADIKDSSITVSLILYSITVISLSKIFALYCFSAIFSDYDFGYISLTAVIILASSFIILSGKKCIYNQILTTLITLVSLVEICNDIKMNLEIIPDYYSPEFSTIFVIAFIVLVNLIWYDNKKKSSFLNIVTYIIACINGLVLLSHNVQVEELACVLTLGIIALSVLLWSIFINDKKYQILSGIILGLMAIYLTRAFWLSIAWWVYLLIVGIICITIAIIKEKNIFNNNTAIKNMTVEIVDINAVEETNLPTDKTELDFLSNNNKE